VMVCPASVRRTPRRGDGTRAAAACNLTSMNIDNQIQECNTHLSDGRAWNPASCPLDPINCTDEWLADAAEQSLEALSSNQDGAPWLAMFGFHKPHPFWALPPEYPAMYEDMPLPDNRFAPVGQPDVSYYSCDSINGRSTVGGLNCNDTALNPEGCQYITPNTTLADETMRSMRASYAGGVTWTDKQIGRVLDKLDALGHREDTLVVFFADHGWALGEQAHWCKMGLLELQTRVPMMIRVPWMSSASTGHSTAAMAELVDVFPTLVELAGFQAPPLDALEGSSLVPVLEAGDGDEAVALGLVDERFNASFMQYPRCMNSTDALEPPYLPNRDPCVGVPSNEFTHMGYCVRTLLWRYCEWPEWRCFDVNACESSPVWSTVTQEVVELYDHTGDDGSCFDCFENLNVASQPAHADLVRGLSRRLRAHFIGPRPHTFPGSSRIS